MKTSFGWAGKMLRVNLTDSQISYVTTLDYASRFIGGRGIASRLYWELIDNRVKAFDPENHLFIMNGPLGGIRATAASRLVIAGKSPLPFPEQYACGNLGGQFGAALKWAGLDGLDIRGVSKKPLVMVIADGKCVFEDAGWLWGKNAFDTISSLKEKFGWQAPIITIGEAGEKLVRFANVIGSGGVSASKGFGAVMGSKNLKAIVVRAAKTMLPVARPEAFKSVIGDINALCQGEKSGRYHENVILEGVEKIGSSYCFGCTGTCRRGLYRNAKGEEGHRISCFSAQFYSPSERAKTGKAGEASFCATQLANKHGLCALQLLFLIHWLPEAIGSGVIDKAETGLDPDKLGSSEWIESLVGLIIKRQGIGDILAEGSRRAARQFNVEKLLEGKVSKAGFSMSGYDPRLYLSLAPIYAVEPIPPIAQVHGLSLPLKQWMIWNFSKGEKGFMTTKILRRAAKGFWGDEGAAEFDSPDKMGRAAALIQNRAYAKENLVMCDWFWPIDYSGNSELGMGDSTLEAKLFSAVTGHDMDEADFLLSGERCANLGRAINLMEGRKGRHDDVLEELFFTQPLLRAEAHLRQIDPALEMPGKDGKTASRKGVSLDRNEFNLIMDDYYITRGWDEETGLFREESLIRLDLADLVPELKSRGCVIQ